ncbi:MAG: SH3 domain-containing protein, partial [archaeon]|nr:SH3 domain-containing protein [archaeon]
MDTFLRCQKAVLDHMGTKYLRIRIIGARNLKANDAGGTSDPYCLAKVGDLPEHKTEVVYKTLAPEWNENGVWILTNPNTLVHLTIFDWNRIGSHSPLGSLGFNVQSLPSDGSEVVNWHQLTPPGSGELNLAIAVNGFSAGGGAEIDPVMDFYLKYVKRDASGKMVVQNLPEAWKMLFERAGTTDEQLKDPNTISVLVKVLHDALKDPSALDRDSGPKKTRQKAICIATAEFDFDPVQQGDLALKIGDVIRVFEKGENGWWKGRIGDREGVFPGNYVGNIKTRTKKPLP